MSEEPPQSPSVPDHSHYRLEHKRSPFIWKSFLRSSGSLGQRWLRRKARQDWVCHPMAPGVDLVTFWLDERLGGGGTGVCMSVFCRGHEVLRFDCFGGELGHFHITPFAPWAIFGGKERRLQFREQSAEQQVERALFEISENLDFYLQLNPKRRVRKLRVDADARRRATTAARQRLQTNLATVPELQGLAVGHRLPAEAKSDAQALPA